MARLAPAVTGDMYLTRTVTLEADGDLDSGADVVAHIWKGDIAPAELECTVTGPDEIEVDFGTWLANDATAGVWLIEYEISFADGEIRTLPGVWPDEIVIRDDHDPETP